MLRYNKGIRSLETFFHFSTLRTSKSILFGWTMALASSNERSSSKSLKGLLLIRSQYFSRAFCLASSRDKYFSSFDLLVLELRKSFQQQAAGWRFGMLLASQAKDPGQGSSYWFCMAALRGVSGGLLCSRSRGFRLSLDP
jgi:hypothetical protein